MPMPVIQMHEFQIKDYDDEVYQKYKPNYRYSNDHCPFMCVTHSHVEM